MPDPDHHLAALAAHLRAHRTAVIEAWRRAVARDPTLTTGATLPRAQLVDHIPVLLQTFECRLDPTLENQQPGAAPDARAGAAAHGLHRWQQGYDLQEVLRELGILNTCVVDELERYAQDHPQLAPGVMATARRRWAEVGHAEFSASIAEYFRLQQLEANGHIADLQRAVDELGELTRLRADLLHEAAHDLRGNMSVVLSATAALNRPEVVETAQRNFLRILDRNVASLQQLLDNVLDMARLQAGKERAHIAQVDVAQLLRHLCEDMQEMATRRQLDLRFTGPSPFLVEGDALKIRRITQNLVVNAIKYTAAGSVTVSWTDSTPQDAKRWSITVQDTGPGLAAAGAAPLTEALEKATEAAQSPSSADAPEPEPEPDAPAQPSADASRRAEPGGEGVGLSIVKRLAELLDATIEVQSTPDAGTTFKVLLPLRYPASAVIR